MFRTWIVTLPAGAQPEFPAACVACGADEPDSRIRVGDRAFHWAALLSPVFGAAGRKAKVAAPACTVCRRGDTLKKWGRILMFCALVWVVLSIAVPWSKSLGLSRAAARWVLLGSVAVALFPAYFWTMAFPRAITVDASKDETAYQFASADYAARFAALNGAEVGRF